jgi:hypothetical protein
MTNHINNINFLEGGQGLHEFLQQNKDAGEQSLKNIFSKHRFAPNGRSSL